MFLTAYYSAHRKMLHMNKYHWIFDNCQKINNICSVSQILENLDFPFDFLLLHRLPQTQKQPPRHYCLQHDRHINIIIIIINIINKSQLSHNKHV